MSCQKQFEIDFEKFIYKIQNKARIWNLSCKDYLNSNKQSVERYFVMKFLKSKTNSKVSEPVTKADVLRLLLLH